MKRFLNKKVATIGLAAGLVLGAAGAAVAYFTSTGSGTTTGYVGSATNSWSVSSAWPSGAYMYPDTSFPGPNLINIPVTITNTTPGNLGLQYLTVGLTGLPTGCLASWFQAGTATNGYALGTHLVTGYAATYSGSQTVHTHVYLELIDDGLPDQTVCAGGTPTVTVSAN